MFNHKAIFATGAVLACLAGAGAVGAGEIGAGHTMYLTVNTPVALPGVGLAPGTYIFELASPDGDPSIVRVLSRDRERVFYMGFTTLVARPAGWREDRPISLGEARPGAPVPIRTWYPAHESMGRRFVYANK